MVTILFDKDFVNNIYKEEQNKRLISDFKDNFLRGLNGLPKVVKVIFNFDPDDENATEKERHFSRSIELLPEETSNNYSSKVEWIEESIKRYTGYMLFFVEIENQQSVDLCNKYGYEIVSSHNFESIWGKYHEKEIKKSLAKIDPTNPHYFKDWSDLNFIMRSPSHSILVIDKYILKNKSNFYYNVFPLIDNLIQENYIGDLDITIVSEEVSDINNKYASPNSNPKEIAEGILKDFIKYYSKYNKIKLNISIVIHDKRFYPDKDSEIHDRVIYTNYFTVSCGAGFDLFNKLSRKTKNSAIEVSFVFQNYEMDVRSAELNTIRAYFEKIKKTEVLPYYFKYHPNIKCELLKVNVS